MDSDSRARSTSARECSGSPRAPARHHDLITTHYWKRPTSWQRVAFPLARSSRSNTRASQARYGQRTATVLLRDRIEEAIRLDDPQDAAKLADWMRADQVLTIHSQEGTLEDVFVALAGRPL